jgi:hypothetical protein
MARKKTPVFIPDPDYQAAYARAQETAHRCAAMLLGEEPVEDPSAQASLPALMAAMGMMYFLLRLDPAILRGLLSEDGIHVRFWKPFPLDQAAPH